MSNKGEYVESDDHVEGPKSDFCNPLTAPPINPGCWYKTPKGCPNHAQHVVKGWRYDTWGRDNRGSSTNEDKCLKLRQREIDEWCGAKAEVAYNPPVCSKLQTTGWHNGTYLKTYASSDAPNAFEWTWRQCASKCAEMPGCEYWTLQLKGPKDCYMMSDKGNYVSGSDDHAEGVKMASCARDPTQLSGMDAGVVAQYKAEQINSKAQNFVNNVGWLSMIGAAVLFYAGVRMLKSRGGPESQTEKTRNYTAFKPLAQSELIAEEAQPMMQGQP
jgi:hypothetical protein